MSWCQHTGYQHSLCWHRWVLSVACLLLSFWIKQHNIVTPQHLFLQKHAPWFYSVCPWKPSRPAVSCVARSSWTAKLGKLWSNVSYTNCGLMNNAPRWRACNISVITASDARSINPVFVQWRHIIAFRFNDYFPVISRRHACFSIA